MLMELANAGVILVNWPENCRHPGQTPVNSNKGISELIAAEQTTLMDALVHPEHPLHFVMIVDVEKKKGTFPSLIHLLSVMLMEHSHAIKRVPCYRRHSAPSVARGSAKTLCLC
jgi:hypothetical protein